MPRSKTTKSKANGIETRYFVTDQLPNGRKKRNGQPQTEERLVYDHDSIYACLDYLRGKCSYSGRVYRTKDEVLLATRKVVSGASTKETGVS